MGASSTSSDRAGESGPTVQVLGRTLVRGEQVTGRQRAILAALALHHGQGADTEVLIDAVWGDDAPRAARQSLHNQITRLRRRFGPDLVITDVDTYRLGALPDSIEFDQLAGRWSTGPLSPETVPALRGALQLWRGTPYSDLADHDRAVAPERARLAELRARSVERLAVGLLVLEEPQAATTELVRLLEDEPFREHTWGLLMLALHRDGRRGDALTAYERASERFVRELGIRPSPELARLSARIADGDVLDLRAWAEIEERPVEASRCGRRRQVRTRCGDHRGVRHA